MLYRVTEPALRPIRRFLPNLGGVDISPVILISLLLFIPRRGAARLDPAGGHACPPDFERGRSHPRARTTAGVTLPVRLTPKSGKDQVAGIETFGDEVY